MAIFQNTVRRELAAGIVGELAFDSPLRAQPGILKDGIRAVVGRFYTKDTLDGKFQRGGTIAADGSIAFGGICFNPKEYASFGPLNTNIGGALDPTLQIAEGIGIEFLQMGMVWLAAPANTPVQEAMVLSYNTTTGEIAPLTAGATVPTGFALIPNAVVYRVPAAHMDVGTVYVAKLTN